MAWAAKPGPAHGELALAMRADSRFRKDLIVCADDEKIVRVAKTAVDAVGLVIVQGTGIDRAAANALQSCTGFFLLMRAAADGSAGGKHNQLASSQSH